ncbi:MAG: Quercetin 2,3-dioxygenase [Chlamydiae bacterium]|nr:Quercetin 2,3-dioxygenase [Chlamydiota bacterium]
MFEQAPVVEEKIIPAKERGVTLNDWLLSRHSFSFGKFHNLSRINFGTLRVLNDDLIQPGGGFGTHPHENMEIITIVLKGTLAHKDSKGNEGILQPGDFQRMTAGSGIQHSEYNPSKTEPLHLLQLWIFPKARDLEPSYEQKKIELKKNVLTEIASGYEKGEGLFFHQEAALYLGEFSKKKTITHKVHSKKSGIYLFLIEGEVSLDGKTLTTGDAAQITGIDKEFEVKTLAPSNLLLIEVNVDTL